MFRSARGDEKDPEEMREAWKEENREQGGGGQRILERVLFQRSPKGESIGFSVGSHGDREANRTIHTISDEDVERASRRWRNHPATPERVLLPFPAGLSREILRFLFSPLPLAIPAFLSPFKSSLRSRSRSRSRSLIEIQGPASLRYER